MPTTAASLSRLVQGAYARMSRSFRQEREHNHMVQKSHNLERVKYEAEHERGTQLFYKTVGTIMPGPRSPSACA